MGIGVQTGLLLKKHTARLWQSYAGPLLKNTIVRQLNILKQVESTDVLESVSRLRLDNVNSCKGWITASGQSFEPSNSGSFMCEYQRLIPTLANGSKHHLLHCSSAPSLIL